jgi:aminopeptidase
MYGTEAMAKEAGLTLEECWKQIIKASFLDFANPIKKWKTVTAEIERVKRNLSRLEISKLHLKSKGTDLTIGIGKNRRWSGGDGRNIPNFEVFTSPDFRMTEGYISFDLPLYRYGNLIENIKLEFKKGKVVHLEAKKGENVLREMIKVKGANQIGEFSLTDVRISRINKFMAETLYDENFGGKYGNVHIALGSSYKETYLGPQEISRIRKKKWQEMGFNNSVVHTDIISTENRVVTAYLENGDKKIIYQNGQFTI